ncbi:MAG: APC family permease [Chloroflexota bacterium]
MRVDRPHAPYFRYTGKGVLTAKPAAVAPTTALGRLGAGVRRVLIGRPLSSDQESEERLSKKKALAIFSSDAISSSAYATEEILGALLVAGAVAFTISLEVAIAIAIMLAIVSTSYRQICYAYPNGGGAYAVGRENLGKLPALVAAGALLVDYILTVAVSTSSAVQQIVSAIPELASWGVLMGVLFILVMTLGNLRGISESGNIFAVPTYLFVGVTLLMIALGAYRIVVLGQGSEVADPLPGAPSVLEPLTLLLVLRAFASGSVALTGVEAIANGVPAFRRPEPRNAATTLSVMAVLLGTLFVGITFLADGFGIVPHEGQTVVAQVASAVFGADSVGFYVFQAFTALILILAANTSYNAFPRLTAILAQDDLMPRQFAFRGDRLAYTLGVLILSAVAIALLVYFGGDTHALIPLYSVGVFVSFTISQGGMVVHWLRDRGVGWRWALSINAIGAALTGVVLVVVLVFKAPQSLLVAVIIPILVFVMLFIERQYRHARTQLEVRPGARFGPPDRRERVVIPVPDLSRAVVQAVQVGRALSADVQVVHVTEDREDGEALRSRFAATLPDVPFVIVESPYRSLVRPFVTWLDVTDPGDDTLTIVVVPEYVASHWWERLLYNQTSRRLREALLGRPDTVVTAVPYRREHEPHG